MSPRPLILDARAAAAAPETLLGGKAWQMAWLTRNGLPVPDWCVVTTEAFQAFTEAAGLADWLQEQLARLEPANVGEVAATIQQRLRDCPLPESLTGPLLETVGRMGGLDRDQFAVRSSVLGEDAATASFAGQMDSLLFQRGEEAIVRAVREVMISAFNERALAYRLQHGIEHRTIQAAVIVQRMVAAEVSGVMFTAHPVRGRRDQILISACWGCGEGVVSGVCSTDEFTVTLGDLAIESQIADKDVAVVFDTEQGQGTREVAVPAERRGIPCLTQEQCKQLARIGALIAGLRRAPQDIEWAIAEGRIHVLQTRPITSLPAPERAKGREIVWDNSNIQESYCGVTTPLTFTFANRAYATVYEQTMRVLGIPERTIAAHRDMLDNMLGLIRGRVYYNINNWYRGLLFLPSFNTNKAAMERMMGLQDPVDLIEERPLTLLEKLRKLPSVLKALVRLLWSFRQMDARVEQFRALFEREYRAVDRTRLHTLEMAELMELARRLDRNLLQRWTTPILNDFYVMMYNARVHKWLARAGVDNPDAVQNNLMSGEEGIESTEPTKYLLRLCDQVRADEGLRQCLESTANERVLDAVQLGWPAFHAACLEYIERYGDRVMGELKLETRTLRDDPSFMFAVLRNFLAREDLSLETLARNEQSLRAEAESLAFGQVRERLGDKALARFRRDLGCLRAAVRHRENMRLARTRMFGLYRDIYREIGRQLAQQGLLDDPELIFYVTVEELDAYMDGRAVGSLNGVAKVRCDEFSAYQEQDLPHHFRTWGPVYHHNRYEYQGAHAAPDAAGAELQGIGCYPGVVERPLRLIFSPQDELNLDGQILCTVRTDPGWAPLFPSAGGLLIERGSTLSHSAVVARELGIPAVVNVPGITKLVRDGERVRLDGSSGRVVLVERMAEAGDAGLNEERIRA